jgi:cold-inducible RNA-binding protein
MSAKIYVGGLPSTATESQLHTLFSQYGTVESARIITDKFTGQSRGFGFVDMSTSQEAQSAIGGLHQTQLGGRTLTVNEAKPQGPRANGGRSGDRGGRSGRW